MMFTSFIDQLNALRRTDVVINSRALQFVHGETTLGLGLPDGRVVDLEDKALAQLGARWGVAGAHLARLPAELAARELRYFSEKDPKDLTVRLVEPRDGSTSPVARAVLSGKYEAFDSVHVLEAINAVVPAGAFDLVSGHVGRDDMRVQIAVSGTKASHDLHALAPGAVGRRVGDVVRAALTVSNSEIGEASQRSEYSLYRLLCTNGMTSTEEAASRVRHVHVKREEFLAALREAVNVAGSVGVRFAQQMAATEEVTLAQLDPDGEKAERAACGVLRRAQLLTTKFVEEANAALAAARVERGRSTLFDLVNFTSDAKRLEKASMPDRLHAERVAGRLVALVG